MDVLVTGATGQIGSSVARALVARGDRVRCLVRDPARTALLDGVDVELFVGDVTDPASVAPAVAGCEAVVHLAGLVSYWRRRRPALEEVNVGGTRNVVEAAARAGVRRLLLTSSIATLGYVEGGGVGDEETPYNWGHLDIGYLETKRRAEELVLAEERLECVAVNPGIVFGERDVHLNAGRMLVQVAEGSLPGVPRGATTCAVLSDVVAGHLAALDRGRPGRRYVLGGTTPTFQELYARIGAVIGCPAPTRVVPPALAKLVAGWHELKAGLTGQEPKITRALVEMSSRNRRYSSARAEAELGYSPAPLEDGIRACRDWYRAQGILPAG